MNVNFPYQFDGTGGTSDPMGDYMNQLIEQVLFTSPGERVNLPDFGSGMLQMVFAPTSPEIAAAQSSGKVWVNTESGVYHKSGRWYGKTKQGKFMTEGEAKSAGYKAAEKE